MHRRNGIPDIIQGQRGLALLIFAILISLVSITLYFSSLSITEIRNENNISASKTMAEAKSALLAYAVLHSVSSPGESGFLPCPDLRFNPPPAIDYEGASEANCGARGVSEIGLFPWDSLETGLLKSRSGGCFWYAVSGDYKNGSVTSNMLNEDTNGLFRVFNADGVTKTGSKPEDRIVAVIIDPSQALAGQARNFDDSSICGKDYTAAHFLEGNGTKDNAVMSGLADTVDDFIRGDATSEQESPPFNDRIEIITRDELWQAVLSRNDFLEQMQNLTAALATCLANYANVTASPNRRLPWPAPYDFAGGDYRVDANYSDVNGAGFYTGRYPFEVDDSNILMSIADGDNVFDIPGLCDNIAVPNPPGNVDLDTDTSEYRKLWKNWKDHFFYMLSKAYEPGTSGETECTVGDCIKVDVGGIQTSYAGVVIFSGSRLAGQGRSAPPLGGDPDEKSVVSNYLEENRDTMFPDATGSGVINDVEPISNDLMYCITQEPTGTPLTVTPC